MGGGHKSVFVLVVITMGISEADEFSRTTAKVRDNTSPRPTFVHRRINVQQTSEETTVGPDLILLGDKVMRRKMDQPDPWTWDHWCLLQSKTGNCTKKLKRYYYDAQLDKCHKFSFTGCQGNKNRFETLEECERHCKGATYTSKGQDNPDDFCSLQPDAGRCLAMFPKFYYDVNKATCKPFVYGGCGGNPNRFNTKIECLERCRPEENDHDMP